MILRSKFSHYSLNIHLNNPFRSFRYKTPGYWNNKENILQFLDELKVKYNLQSSKDWNSIKTTHIKSNGGGTLLKEYSIYELKCMACPSEKYLFNKPVQNKPLGYWKDKNNILQFLEELKHKNNIKSPEDWNLISTKQIKSNGGGALLKKYSIHELKCMACPEGKSIFNKPNHPPGYWDNTENIIQFLQEIKEKYNLKTPKDWNSISKEKIHLHGGTRLFVKYSLYDLKCLACPEGKLYFNKPNQPSGYWDNKENILHFLQEIKEKYNLKSPDDWNLITQKEIKLNGGSSLFKQYSMYDLKVMICPEGKLIFTQPSRNWDEKENIIQFLNEMKEKYNLKTPEDWNSITQKEIKLNGGNLLLKKYSLYELKCMACPNENLIFNKPIKPKSLQYWENKENILQFLKEIKEKYNLKTPDDWNLITRKHIHLHGGYKLLDLYLMYDLKCLACPEGKFDKPSQPTGYWNDEINRNNFIENLKVTFNLKTPMDWKRISRNQIKLQRGHWLFNDKEYLEKTKIKFIEGDKSVSYSLKELTESNFKRSSQRWLFLQVQKLFPGEEIVEDYFHSEISRKTGFSVQFDVFLIKRNIAIEYHGQQHYEDIPSVFSSLEMYKNRDEEKEKLCKQFDIQLIIIPYWWDNKLPSLKDYLFSKINL